MKSRLTPAQAAALARMSEERSSCTERCAEARRRWREMADAYLAGEASYSIGDRFGISWGSVIRILREHDVPIRKPGNPHLRNQEKK